MDPGKQTVLVVDDEKNIRRTLRMVLETEGYAVAESETAEDALKLLESEPVDLGVFDVRLPGMDGLTLRSLEERVKDLSTRERRFGDEMLGDSPALRRLRDEIAKVAPTQGRVLVTGESGTGKELIAQEIHRLSKRAAGPFVKVKCAPIP